MPLTDTDGNAIPADDPRLPSPEDTAAVLQAADRLEGLLVQATGDAALGPSVAVQAAIEALVGTFVPPMEDHPIRRMYDHRFQVERLRVLQQVAQAMDEARRGPAIAVAQSVPQDLRGGILKP